MIMELKQKIRVSVRNLVEFILRTGDIDSGFVGTSNNRALEGTRIHKKVQNASGGNYESEVILRYDIEYEDYILSLEGRADGIIKDKDAVTIDEIKSTTSPLEKIDEDFNPLHWAQAKCYAFIYAEENRLSSINVQLTYYQIDTDEIKRIVKEFRFEELKQFFFDLIEKYFIWTEMQHKWNIKRDISIKELSFPHKNYRKGQRELAVAAYKTIVNGKKLYAQAPTGIGKTISTVFPAVKAMGEGHISKIFYLTAKTITRTVAGEAFSLMREKGLHIKTVVLTAKDKICFKEKATCNPESCEYAKGHYDRVNDAIMDILTNEDELNREIIEKYAQKHCVCPFEFSLDLTLWADAVICDYNYVFDPSVSLKRFFAEKGGDYAFLIDEAHNLVDRAREMYSSELYKKPFLDFKREVKATYPKLSKALNKINQYMLDIKKKCNSDGYYIKEEFDSEIYFHLKKFITECEEYLLKNKNAENYEEYLNLYFDALAFIRICELYDDRYITYAEKANGDIKLKLYCLDPSHLLKETLRKGRAAIFFSATLIPMDYHKYILGGEDDDYTIYLNSPFPIENRCILVADSISTKYRDREGSYLDIVEYISSVLNAKKGNYLIFFPSYQYMNKVYELFTEKYPEYETYIQEPDMTEEEREDFLELFELDKDKNVIGFCVLGGIFSEGIDLKHDRLIGVIIVGVGLPQICLERDIIRDYFNKVNNLGYEYSYMYPGMTKVLQAAGRLIRTEEDRGIILLLDERFVYSNYQRLFPREWFPYIRVNNDNIEKYLCEFWKRQERFKT